MTSNFSPFGVDLFGNPIDPRADLGVVSKKFLWPPFSAIDARSGDWQDRKKSWLALGIESEVGREGANVLNISASGDTSRSVREAGTNQDDPANEYVSIFDPCLCEVLYRWFCPKGGTILDPFAGGSVRGIVAAALGYRYVGVELREVQVEANARQLHAITRDNWPGRAGWIEGDSRSVLVDPFAAIPDEADFVFSCPPYGDLEVYSDDPRDLSRMDWSGFSEAYFDIVFRSVKRLADNRFAAFVVGDFRDSRGFYRNFVSQTITAFERAGARLYNEAILVVSVGSASLRVTRQFDSTRKMAKTHQNVLIFCKGDPLKAAKAAIGDER